MKILLLNPDHLLAPYVAVALINLGHEPTTESFAADAILVTLSTPVADLPVNTRIVLASTTSVYQASAIFRRQSDHPPTLAILSEESPLQNSPAAEFEQTYRAAGATIVRLPPLYGIPPDILSEFLAPMDAKRPAILLNPDYANWKCSLADIENAAHALALCLTHKAAASETFNIAEPRTPTIAERAHQIAKLAKYRGLILALPRDRVPSHLEDPAVNFRQDLIINSDKIRRTLGYVEPWDISRHVPRDRAHFPHTPLPENIAAEDAILKSLGILR